MVCGGMALTHDFSSHPEALVSGTLDLLTLWRVRNFGGTLGWIEYYAPLD